MCSWISIEHVIHTSIRTYLNQPPSKKARKCFNKKCHIKINILGFNRQEITNVKISLQAIKVQ